MAKEDDVALEQPWNVRVFALHRIKQVEISMGKFSLEEEELVLFKDKDLFDFKKYDDVEIEFFYPEAERIKERFITDNDVIISQTPNSIVIRLQNVSEYTVFPLIFRAMGHVRIIKPAALQESLYKVAQNISADFQR